MAPAPYKKKQEVEVKDPDSGKTMIGADGKPWMEEVEVIVPAFKPVTVFDVSSTEGKPLPEIGVDELLSSVEGYLDLIKALNKVSPVPIAYEDIESGAKGYFSPSEQRIVIQKDMAEAQTIKTEIHEICHSLLDDKDHVRMEGIDDTVKRDRSTKEVTAEAVAYTVSAHFGIDTSDYSFSYLAGWSSGKEMSELKESMELIRKTASKLITDIESELNIIRAERSVNMAKDLATEVDNFMYSFDTYGYMDSVDDRDKQILDIAVDIKNMDAGYLVEYFKEIVISKEGTDENIKKAQELIDKINAYKPLKKIEELVETNYNMIDEVLNNGVEESLRKEEERKSDSKDNHKKKHYSSKRPSLKKRLKEKVAQVAVEPERPAKEKALNISH